MNTQPPPDPAARVSVRTDGPPIPLHLEEDAPYERTETFWAMSRRRLPWLLLAVAGSVLLGKLIGDALTVTS